MPTYEYECSQCGETFDYFQSMKDAHLTDCPNTACNGKGTVKRLIGSGAGIIFKGSGFYQTDYKKNHSSGSPSKPNGSKAKAEGGEACASCPKEGCPGKEG